MALVGRLIRPLSRASCVRASLRVSGIPALCEGQIRHSSDAPYLAESPPVPGILIYLTEMMDL